MLPFAPVLPHFPALNEQWWGAWTPTQFYAISGAGEQAIYVTSEPATLVVIGIPC